MRFADLDDVVIQKRCFAIVGTHAPACATPLLLELQTGSNQIHLGGRRRAVRRLPPRLHCTSQRFKLLRGVFQKAYIDLH
jgi:hypothetical protein